MIILLMVAAFLAGRKWGGTGKFLAGALLINMAAILVYETGWTLETLGAFAALTFLFSPAFLMLVLPDID